MYLHTGLDSVLKMLVAVGRGGVAQETQGDAS